jgi:PAS domain-containing protein
MIATSGLLAPRSDQPFVIIDGTLSLCALSRTAEKLLGVTEPDVINRHVGEYLEPADAEAADGDELLRSIIAVAGGQTGSHTVVVRPTGEYGVRYAARIGRCGPPSAALLVLSDGVV